MNNQRIIKAIKYLKQGKMVILTDRDDRENEGDLVALAEKITPETINFMITQGRGLVCLSLTPEQIKRLGLSLMTSDNQSPFHTNFTVSIEARYGISTGISAGDRAHTIHTAADPQVSPADIVVPGHIFPLKTHKQGVFGRDGQTEGSLDLAKLCGSWPAAVICEVLKPDGTMARQKELKEFSKKFDIPVISINDIKEYRIRNETLVTKVTSVRMPTKWSNDFTLHGFQSHIDGTEILVLEKGKSIGNDNCPVRIHSECFTGDILHSLRCDCNDQLHKSIQYMVENNSGLLIYLRQEGRGIGLLNKLKAYAYQEQGLDTVEANIKLGFRQDLRDYGNAYQILKYYSMLNIRLITNNPEKISGLEQYGINIKERISLNIPYYPQNIHYLKTKREKLGHLLEL